MNRILSYDVVLLKKQRPTARNAVLGSDTRLSFVDGSLKNEWMPKSHYVLIPRRTLTTRFWIRVLRLTSSGGFVTRKLAQGYPMTNKKCNS